MSRRPTKTEHDDVDAADLEPADYLDPTLDAVITLIDASASPDTQRVFTRHLDGAFQELVDQGKFPAAAKDTDQASEAPDIFSALDELIDLGFVSLSFQGYGLTELGKLRAATTADPAFDDVAREWRI